MNLGVHFKATYLESVMSYEIGSLFFDNAAKIRDFLAWPYLNFQLLR